MQSIHCGGPPDYVAARALTVRARAVTAHSRRDACLRSNSRCDRQSMVCDPNGRAEKTQHFACAARHVEQEEASEVDYIR